MSTRVHACVLLVFVLYLLVQPADLKGCSCSSSSGSGEDGDVGESECCNLSFEDCAKKECCDKDKDKYVVCYFTDWAWYRSGRASFRPENINATLCTHILYAFASLDPSTLLLTVYDSWADIDNNFYELVTAYKDQGVQVLISCGGWTNSGGTHWSQMLNNSTARSNFVKSAVEFMEKYDFCGLDLDYEYPGCPQGNRTAGLTTDKANFNQLVSELKTEFDGKYLLTLAAAGGKSLIDDCFDMAELCQLVDWVNIMGYDYYSYLDGYAGANAPICGSNGEFGVYETVKYYLKDLRCPSSKIVLGLPFYGKSYTMVSPSPAQLGVPVSGPGTAGNYTKEAGTLAYYEICELLNSGWKSSWNKINGSYAWNGNQLISYDGKIDIVRKSCLINKYFDLQGGMVWNLDNDDFNDICGGGSYPLLKTLNQQLRCLEPACDSSAESD